ncbi:MAG TPA: hypothetical protein VFS05_00200, partial [Gemmatimonadaceae bacterium]|nr:hypothetical protein [Gemmatimonadaceae bacterium]
AGDLVLREGMRRLVAVLTEPCGGAPDLAPPADSLVARLAGDGPLAAARALRRAGDASSPATPWLLGAALLLVIAEPGVRALGAARQRGEER